VKYWEIIADNLSKAGWSWDCVSAFDSQGRTIWIADAHCGDAKRFIVRADEKLTAFLELEATVCPQLGGPCGILGGPCGIMGGPGGMPPFASFEGFRSGIFTFTTFFFFDLGMLTCSF
jgi:hypothetical protein